MLAIQELEKYLEDDKVGYDKEEIDLAPRKNEIFYQHQISNYARQGKTGIRKALELFNTMKSKDRLTPTVNNFSPLIYGCAKAGYTKKAFELYTESLKYGCKRPTNSTVTCLMNACAECPFPEYGLERLDWFREHLKLDCNHRMNEIQYSSAIKAYGKLGKLSEASNLVKEMISEGLYPNTATFNALLIGCASNKEAGTTYALRVYKRMRFYGLRPNLITYRILLRCIRDCGVGSDELIRQAIGELPLMTSFEQRLKYKKLSKKGSPRERNFEWVPLITELGDSLSSATSPQTRDSGLRLIEQKLGNSETALISSPSAVQVSLANSTNELPNLLSEDHLDLMHRIESICVDRLRTGADRLMLFGGMHGYLKTMVRDGCEPDSKTFSLMLSCIKRKRACQLEYFRLSKDYNIKRDLYFYDSFLRHVCENFLDKSRLSRAMTFLEEMHKDGLRPNVTTFEALALGCDDSKTARRLLSDIESCGLTISNDIMRRFVYAAANNNDFNYLTEVIKLFLKYNCQPIRQVVDFLEEKRIETRDLIFKYEKGLLRECDRPAWLSQEQIKAFDKFTVIHSEWLRSVELADEEHPWAQFHVESNYKKAGFNNFVQTFKIIEEVKREALREGRDLRNLQAEVRKRCSESKRMIN